MSLASMQSPFQSFWMAGYECTDQLNCFGHRVDFLPLTGHLQLLDQDYQDIRQHNLSTVREGIRWSHIEKIPYQYDWSTVRTMLAAGRRHGIQQIWDICHFGYPDDLTPLHPLFAERFTALCRAFVQFYRSEQPEGQLIVTPINEVSFVSWLGGDVRGTSPYCVHQGWEVKYGLMRAYIQGVAAMREIDPTVRILTTEPLINIIPRAGATRDEKLRAAQYHDNQFQAVDMLTGRMCPELGGRPEYVDMLGFNFYYDNQWDMEPRTRIPWADQPADRRWRPLRHLLAAAHKRYNRPVVLTETSHPGHDRPHWMAMIGRECAAALRMGVPLWGVCLYPILDRPDWDFLDQDWHRSGLWDAVPQPDGPPLRVLHEPYAKALQEAQVRVARALVKSDLPAELTLL
ncbi:amine oxidase [Hymenobacter sp.]|uniref:amine oxidase n=1 Tax=Hymenobacter sp. TaxID=1898978 RepID=UPI002EDA36A2